MRRLVLPDEAPQVHFESGDDRKEGSRRALFSVIFFSFSSSVPPGKASSVLPRQHQGR